MNDKTAANAAAPKTAATKTAAAQAKKQAQAQVDAQKRRAAVTWMVVGVIVVGLMSALVAFIVRQGAVDDVAIVGASGSPVVSNTDGFGVGSSGIVGKDLDASRVRLDVYFDFICPYCALFENSQAATLDDLRSQGIVDVYYHPLAYLDDASSGTKYSTRAASAAALVAERIPRVVHGLSFSSSWRINQRKAPTGLTDAQIQLVGRGRWGARRCRGKDSRPRVRRLGSQHHRGGKQGWRDVYADLGLQRHHPGPDRPGERSVEPRGSASPSHHGAV